MAITDDDYDDDDELETPPSGQDSPLLKQLRKELRDARKAAKDNVAELEALREFRTASETAVREAATSKAFEEAGLPPKLAKLYMKEVAEGTPSTQDALAYAADYGLAAPADSTELQDSFQPLQVGRSGPVSNKLSREQYTELKNTDFEAAMKAVEDGRVEGFTASYSPNGGAQATDRRS